MLSNERLEQIGRRTGPAATPDERREIGDELRARGVLPAALAGPTPGAYVVSADRAAPANATWLLQERLPRDQWPPPPCPS